MLAPRALWMSFSGNCPKPVFYPTETASDNADDEFQLGFNFFRRFASAGQQPTYGYMGVAGSSASAIYNVWDVYAERRFGTLKLALEMPFASGVIGGIPYSTFAALFEGSYEINKTWSAGLKAGYVPGATAVAGGPTTFDAFFVNPGYKIGLIMFNYNLAGFYGPATLNDPTVTGAGLRSIYDHPISDAIYFDVGGKVKFGDKWDAHGDLIYAVAPNGCTQGTTCLNYWERKYYANTAGGNQSNALGFEVDLGGGFQFDDAFRLDLDLGVFLPGAFYQFTNVATQNVTDPVWAVVIKGGVEF